MEVAHGGIRYFCARLRRGSSEPDATFHLEWRLTWRCGERIVAATMNAVTATNGILSRSSAAVRPR